MATIYKTDGSTEKVNPANGSSFSLKELQTVVGGYVDIIYQLPGDANRIMVVNDEGRLKGLPRNGDASAISGRTIAGDVLVCLRSEVE